MSGSSEAPTYESLSISERKDVLKNVSSLYFDFCFSFHSAKNEKKNYLQQALLH